MQQFLAAEGTPGERPAGEQPPPDEDVQSDGSGGADKPQGGDKPHGGDDPKPEEEKPDERLRRARRWTTRPSMGQTYAQQVSAKRKNDGDPMVDFPIYYPTRLAPGSFLARDSRAFLIDGPDKDVYYGYKMVADVPGDLRPRPARRVLRRSRAPTGSTRRSSTTRARPGRSTAGTTCCSTTATGCAWSAGRPTRPPTGSTTRCCSRSTRVRCSRSRPRCASSKASSVRRSWKRARSRRSASSGWAGSAW